MIKCLWPKQPGISCLEWEMVKNFCLNVHVHWHVPPFALKHVDGNSEKQAKWQQSQTAPPSLCIDTLHQQ